MKHCETCKFMAAPRGLIQYGDDGSEGVVSKHRSCARIIHGNGDARNSPETLDEPAIVTDGSGYAARLLVLPTFGCVLHEEKL